MPSKKKKYNARFPAGRIKKIMQTDDEVGKVAQAVPIIISRTLELFVHSLLTKTMQFTSAKNAKTLSPSHMKQCILSESRFDFLKDLVKGLPDISSQDDEVPTPPSTPSTPSVPLTPSLPLTTSQIIVTPTSTTVHSSTTQHTEIRAIKQMGSLSDKSVQDKNIKIVGREESVNLITINEVKISPKSKVPEFQISVPPTFNINQPNFYTEVNPMNVNDNSSLKPTNQVTCNYAQSSNIDEDYDT